MTKQEFLKEIETIIGAAPGSITMEDGLRSLAGWDSMAILSFIAIIDEKLQVTLDLTALASCVTVGDLAGLLEGKVACTAL